MRKGKSELSNFIKTWADYKIDVLSTLSDNLDDVIKYVGKIALPEWKDAWFVYKWDAPNKDEKHHVTTSIYNSWDDFFKRRIKKIENFLKTGVLTEEHDEWFSTEFDIVPYSDIADNDGIFQVLKKDCDDLIKVIENYSIAKDINGFFHTIENAVLEISSYWDYSAGRYDVTNTSKESDRRRTMKSTETLKRNRKTREKYVYEEFLRMVMDKNSRDKKVIAGLSEYKLARMIKEQIIGDLKRNGIDKISEETIIDILRKRDKSRFTWYPWEKTSKM